MEGKEISQELPIMQEMKMLIEEYEQLLQEADPARLALLAAADVLVDGPFLLERRTLDMRFRGSDNQRGIDMPEKDLTVLLPRTVAENLTAVDLSGVSADFAVGKLTVRDAFSFDTTSGKLEMQSMNAPQAKATVSSVSGKVELDGSFREVKAGSTSGEIDLMLRNAPAAVEVSTVSGEVDVELPAGTGFTLDYSTVSGELEYDFPLTKSKDGKYVCGDGACRIEVGTTSGSLSVERLG